MGANDTMELHGAGISLGDPTTAIIEPSTAISIMNSRNSHETLSALKPSATVTATNDGDDSSDAEDGFHTTGHGTNTNIAKPLQATVGKSVTVPLKASDKESSES